jgi:aminoglycoside phosphotransferase family enzyme/predicted kinase
MGAQQDLITWLASPSTHGGNPVERIDTHSAVVFLVGDRALKLKRAVTYDYLDFSTEALRRAACEAEVRINRRAAPSIYRGVLAVTREPGGAFSLNGQGPVVDWVVEMSRFRQEDLFDRLAARGALDLDLMAPLAAAIADFHRTADRRDDQGGAAGMRWVIEGNAQGFTEQGTGILDPRAAATLTGRTMAELGRQTARLERRRREGRVRQCHGDLHLRNLVLIDGAPTLFDAVEFNDRIACGDVFYDLAFLLMDLWRRDLRRHANVVLNAYVAITDDVDGLALLPLFLSCRAAVRAKTSATSARLQSDVDRRRELENLARRYLEAARVLLDPPHARLVAVGGLSGAGKTTLARALAPDIGAAPGALILRSDEIRKAVCGVPALERLGPDGYLPEVTARVYDTIARRAAATLATGHSAIADAVYGMADHRAAIEAVARAAGAPFTGVWLDAPAAVLVSRVSTRQADASDADEAVVRRQLEQDVGAIGWDRVAASGDPDDVRRRALAVVAGTGGV